jgi:apolipoprotein N-acyltransferase
MNVILAGVASGLLFYLSQGLADVWVLAWFAPAPLLWLAYGNAPRWQILLAAVSAFLAGQAYLVQCYWGRLPPLILAPLVVVMTAAFAAAVFFARVTFRRESPWVTLFAFPALWTALEYLVSLASPHGSYGAMGYALVSFPAGIQLASLFGVYSVTFLLCLSANSVALMGRHRRAPAFLGAALCAGALIFGFVRLAQPEAGRVEVAALTDVDARNTGSHSPESAQAAAAAYVARIEKLGGAQVVVIPEGAFQMRDADQERVLAPLESQAKANGMLVLAGTLMTAPERNRAFAFLPDGTVRVYTKRHPLLPFEQTVPGRDPGVLGAGFATQICKDMDFPSTVRETAAHGVRLMIVPADDFVRDGWIHARIAVMRGVENGFAVLRAAFDGLETVSDAQGRILATASTIGSGMVVLSAEVPLGPGPTLYTRIGDVFPWLCALAVLFIGLRAFRKTASAPATAMR